MNISSNFNRFYHSAVLTELYRKCGALKFHGWVDTESGEVLTFIKGENFNDMDDLKQILKNMNLDYAVDEDKKVSTSKIESNALIQHIEWCIRLAGLNGIEFSFVEDEWSRLMDQCH